jgi:hypothetical protein
MNASASHLPVVALVAAWSLGAGLVPVRASVPASGSAAAGVTMSTVLPSVTEPAVSGFDTPHRIYLRRDLAAGKSAAVPDRRHELLLWVPGTAPLPSALADKAAAASGREGSEAFCRLAAQLGYHVISLRYPNSISATAARLDEDPTEFERFRLAIIKGGSSKHITIAPADSIENRLIKLLQHLATVRPAEGWSEFLTDHATIRWERIAVAGQSQGGGHAALIGIRQRVARVICTGAPKDFNQKLGAPAAWMNGESATPKSRFFTFNHRQDRQGVPWPQQLQILHALKLDAFGPPVDVDAAAPPYRHSRILFTNYPGGNLSSKEAHTAVISWRNAGVFEPVWRYLLTEPNP